MAKEGVARGKVIEFVLEGGVDVVPIGTELPTIRDLLNRYADVPMDFADACIVRLTEIHPGASVYTKLNQGRHE